MINLSREDFQQFVDLLSSMEDFRTEIARWRLIDDVLTGAPREDVIRGQIDLSGRPRPAAVSLLTTFQKFGQVAPGQELIGILANRLLDGYIFDPEPVAFLRGLFARYPLDRPVAPQQPITDWKGTDSPEDVFEKIIGENTLRDVALLELALEAAGSVVRIRGPNTLGSGFLCGADIVMTCHHVIADPATAQNSEYTFFYELNRQGIEKPTQTVAALPGGLFFSDPALDVALIQVREVPDGVTPLALKRQRVKRDDRVSIIQHPGGHYKKISMQNNFVEYADTQVIQYTTSTELGSSGSPVFNDTFQVIAVHHSGGMLPDPQTSRRHLRNAGSLMTAVLAAVEQHAPELHSRLHIA